MAQILLLGWKFANFAYMKSSWNYNIKHLLQNWIPNRWNGLFMSQVLWKWLDVFPGEMFFWYLHVVGSSIWLLLLLFLSFMVHGSNFVMNWVWEGYKAFRFYSLYSSTFMVWVFSVVHFKCLQHLQYLIYCVNIIGGILLTVIMVSFIGSTLLFAITKSFI